MLYIERLLNATIESTDKNLPRDDQDGLVHREVSGMDG